MTDGGVISSCMAYISVYIHWIMKLVSLTNYTEIMKYIVFLMRMQINPH